MDNPTSLSSANLESPSGVPFQTSSSSPGLFCCQHTKANARNLVVCIDGTSNQFGKNNTNVVKLFADLNRDSDTPHPKQYAYYSSGIGTSPKSLFNASRMKTILSDYAGMAIAWNIEEIVKNAYEWLAQRYEDGDRIFLFGFSRGAYQARVLAAMIHEVGLIKTVTEKQIATAYDHYRDIQPGRGKVLEIAGEFKKMFSWEGLKVHFIGVWDTVSSVGLVKQDVFLSASSSAAHACHSRHALALDERRVKFMPEYFHETNSLTNNRKCEHAVSEKRQSGVSSNETVVNIPSELEEKNDPTPGPDIKEVWFAGSHADIGGMNRPGNAFQAGNIPFLWMRREAAEHGLALQPTDMAWVPGDLDFGVNDSMGYAWRVIEYLPIKHQVLFGGAGENKQRPHYEKPRRIIPGQKVHASILYSNAYRPQATLGKGFDMPIIHPGLEHTELDDSIWETGLFDSTAAKCLLGRLGCGHVAELIYLDRLLFMLRFKEGKEYVRSVDGSKDKLKGLMNKSDCSALVKLVTIVVYYEAFCEHGVHTECVSLNDPSDSDQIEAIFRDAKRALRTSIAEDKHPDGARAVSLLEPLTKHQILRQKLLTKGVLGALVGKFDRTVELNVKHTSVNFCLAMNGLTYLSRFKDTRNAIVGKLSAPYPNPSSAKSRLSRILDIDNSDILTLAALRMVLSLLLTLSQDFQDSETKALCTEVKPRLSKLAKKYVGPVGSLAAEILVVLCGLDKSQLDAELDLRSPKVRINLAHVLLRWNPSMPGSGGSSATDKAHLTCPIIHLMPQTRGRDSGDGRGHSEGPGRAALRQLFGLTVASEPIPSPQQKRFILQFKFAIQHGTTQERTTSTMTLLILSKSEAIRAYLLEIKLLDTFIGQLKCEDSALLAAYALAICLTYGDMMLSIKCSADLLKNILHMIRKDYFDDAIGQVEGFDVFRSFMRHEELRGRIEEGIVNILAKKLAKGLPKEIRTSLVCLDILRSFNMGRGWSRELVEKSLKHLRKSTWEEQKVGVTILSALAQTGDGIVAIGPYIINIVEMLLPCYRQPQVCQNAPTAGIACSGEGSATGSTESVDLSIISSNVASKVRTTLRFMLFRRVLSRKSPETLSTRGPGEEPWPRALSQMMGPACALRVLVRNKELRVQLRQSQRYNCLRNLHLSGALAYRNGLDTSVFNFRNPNRKDVIYMLDKLIKLVNEDPADECFKSIEDAVLRYIRPWNRFFTLLRNTMMATLWVPPAAAGMVALVLLASLIAAPVYVLPRLFKFCKRELAHVRLLYILLRVKRRVELDAPSTPRNEIKQTASQHPGIYVPRFDVYESGDTNMVTITLELPGLTSDNVTIDVQLNQLIVSAEIFFSDSEERTHAIRECHSGKFSRTVQLPFGIKPEDINAKMESGILTIMFPKMPSDQEPKRIAIL